MTNEISIANPSSKLIGAKDLRPGDMIVRTAYVGWWLVVENSVKHTVLPSATARVIIWLHPSKDGKSLLSYRITFHDEDYQEFKVISQAEPVT